jgi:hypothetical protein
MSNSNDKIIFSCIGEFKDVDGRRRFIPDSPDYYVDRSSKQPLNKKYTCDFTTKVPTRSEAQLAYHWILCQYISEHTGFQPGEVHQMAKQLVWGTKTVKIGKYTTQVCKSISDKAMTPKYEVVLLIEKDLEMCADNDIRVPTRKELGYIDTDEKIKPIKNYPKEDINPTF